MIEKLMNLITAYVNKTGQFPNRLHLSEADYNKLCEQFKTDKVTEWRGMYIEVGEGPTEVYKSCNKQRSI